MIFLDTFRDISFQLTSGNQLTFDLFNYLSDITDTTLHRIVQYPIEKGRCQSIPRDPRLCPLCLGNLIGDEKHYIFYCTIDKLVDIRKDFVKELHESNLQSCFNDAAFQNSLGMILKGTCRMKLDKIGKFLSAVLVRTDALLRETE